MLDTLAGVLAGALVHALLVHAGQAKLLGAVLSARVDSHAVLSAPFSTGVLVTTLAAAHDTAAAERGAVGVGTAVMLYVGARVRLDGSARRATKKKLAAVA